MRVGNLGPEPELNQNRYPMVIPIFYYLKDMSFESTSCPEGFHIGTSRSRAGANGNFVWDRSRARDREGGREYSSSKGIHISHATPKYD